MNDRHDDAELDAAYARAKALACDGRGPAASVRANVLAAAREAAARAAAEAGAPPPVAPVTSPVAAVGQGRPTAVNRASWRLQAGVAAGVVLVAALGVWRLDATRRADGPLQVASVSREPAPAAPVARKQPAATMAAPPPVADAQARHEPAASTRSRTRRPPRDVVVAQAGPAEPAERLAPPPEVPAAKAVPPSPAETRPAAAATSLSRRVTLAAPSAPRETTLAAADGNARRVQVAGSSLRQTEGSNAAPAPVAFTRPMPTLHAAARHGDVDALKALLARPDVRVDAPDAAGRSALLHAVLAQQADAVRLLLAAGADPDRADPAGLTPRAAARAGASAEVAGLLGPAR